VEVRHGGGTAALGPPKQRDPRVAMLFSDPTASGLSGAPELLLQGTANCRS
jgi:hypothetical protein